MTRTVLVMCDSPRYRTEFERSCYASLMASLLGGREACRWEAPSAFRRGSTLYLLEPEMEGAVTEVWAFGTDPDLRARAKAMASFHGADLRWLPSIGSTNGLPAEWPVSEGTTDAE